MALRHRLTLLAAGTVGAAILLAAIVCYVAMRNELRDQVDEALLAQAVPAQRIAARAELGRGLPVLPPVRGSVERPGWVQVIGPEGDVLGRVAGDPAVPPTAGDRRIAAGTGEPRLDDRSIAGVHARVLTLPVPGVGAVQLARSLEAADATLAQLRLVLVLLLVGATAFAVGVARVFTRAVIEPVSDLTQAAEHIEATGDLSRRVDAAGQDEVGRLAQRFNSMLDRLEVSRTALASSVSAQRRLVADASHELRTPITSLRTNVELLLEGVELSGPERERLLADVREQTEELSALINDVIELARGEEPADDLEDVAFDELVAEAIERARRHAPAVAFSAALDPVVVAGARERLGRAVTNLLDNAAKHSPPGATVEVTLHGGELRVRDHGPGVPDDEAPHVFDRFYRGTSARERPGSGLGLAIVRQVAETHGGSVGVAHAAGGGALFTLRLPVIAERVPA